MLNKEPFTNKTNSYLQIGDPFRATLVKVIPTPNNGFTELLKLDKIKVSVIIILS